MLSATAICLICGFIKYIYNHKYVFSILLGL